MSSNGLHSILFVYNRLYQLPQSGFEVSIAAMKFDKNRRGT
jgi:hypothetical protein